MTSPETVVLDTNVLIYAMNAEAPMHKRARTFYDQASAGKIRAYLAPQVLFEYFSAITHPSMTPAPIPPREALDEIRQLASSFPVLPAPTNLLSRVFTLLAQTGFSGRHIHDIHLAAMALENGITRICTFDTRFQNIPGMIQVTP